MIKKLFPRMYVDSIYDIPYKTLLQQNIKGLVFDIDNTLAPFDVPVPDEKLIAFMKNLQDMGFDICLLSNNNKDRVDKFNTFGLPSVAKAGKPKLSGVKRAVDLIGISVDNIALIGDQIFTDVWCGNRIKAYTVLVKPIAGRDEFTVKLKRGMEKMVIKLYLRGLE